jgi:hypothetical protein
MNIPNNNNAKIKFEYLNFSLDNAKPFIDPIIAEISVAGIVRYKLFFRFGLSLAKATLKPSKDIFFGKFHIVAIDTSSNGLKEVLIVT